MLDFETLTQFFKTLIEDRSKTEESKENEKIQVEAMDFANLTVEGFYCI